MKQRLNPRRAPASHPPGMRILVVDDSAETRDELCRALRPEYEIAEAADGEQAVRLVGRTRPDLVLLDVGLPGIDGLETLRRLGALDPGLPVYMIGEDETLPEVVHALDCGADGYVLKPLQTARVIARLRGALSAAST